MTLELWLVYVATVLIASIVPGPSMLLALTHGLRFGAARATATALGNVAASLLQAGVSMAGLGVLLLASQTAFLAVKYAGAAYLVYLGVCMWRTRHPAKIAPPASEHPDTQRAARQSRSLFAQGFLVALGNPKAVIFFTALFPQFLSSDGLAPLRALVMTATLAVVAFLCFMLYATGGQRAAEMARRMKTGPLTRRFLNRKAFDRTVGTTFIAAGLGLALSDR